MSTCFSLTVHSTSPLVFLETEILPQARFLIVERVCSTLTSLQTLPNFLFLRASKADFLAGLFLMRGSVLHYSCSVVCMRISCLSLFVRLRLSSFLLVEARALLPKRQ